MSTLQLPTLVFLAILAGCHGDSPTRSEDPAEGSLSVKLSGFIDEQFAVSGPVPRTFGENVSYALSVADPGFPVSSGQYGPNTYLIEGARGSGLTQDRLDLTIQGVTEPGTFIAEACCSSTPPPFFRSI
jgi:hypothetical protein